MRDVQPARLRLSAGERRDQLTEIGLELLADRPIHEVALDEVADRAGISRSLLFHYFPNKSDFYAAVVERAGQRLLGSRGARRSALSGASVPRGPVGTSRGAEEEVRSLVDGYLRLVDESRDLYLRLVRGAASGDPAVVATINSLRDELVPVWLAAAGWDHDASDDPLRVLLVRGWLVGLEEVALAWDPAVIDRTDLTAALVSSFLDIAAREDRGIRRRSG